jgi:chromosomal replication initiator protein
MKKDYVAVWGNCLKIIKDNIHYQSFKTWFEPISPVKLENNVLTIQVPSQFFYEWLEEHYISLLKKTIKKELGMEGRLEYSIIMDNTSNNNNPYTIKVPTANKKATKNPAVSMPIDLNKGQSKDIPNPFIIPGLKKIKVQSQLVDNYSFDSFIEGDCNRLARSAGFAVAEKPGKTAFNPLFLYSDVGLGKTHLAHAIGIQAKSNFPDLTVLYVSTEQFIAQYIDSDKAPVEMKGVEPRLLSRFKWGLAADLQIPDLETRIAILQKRLYNDGIEIPKDVIEYLAYSITTNIRELEGALISILAQSSLNKKPITIELAKKMIDKFVKSTTREISIDYIQKVVCDYFELPLDVINSKTRKREIVQARQLAMFFAKKHTKSSLATIGLHCGNKDHATVLHACRTVNNLIETDRQFRVFVEDLDKKIKL